MKHNFEVWSEGFSTTGSQSTATFHGTYDGESFAEACGAWVDEYEERRKHFNQKRLTFWGCKLFDNETDARKVYG